MRWRDRASWQDAFAYAEGEAQAICARTVTPDFDFTALVKESRIPESGISIRASSLDSGNSPSRAWALDVAADRAYHLCWSVMQHACRRTRCSPFRTMAEYKGPSWCKELLVYPRRRLRAQLATYDLRQALAMREGSSRDQPISRAGSVWKKAGTGPQHKTCRSCEI